MSGTDLPVELLAAAGSQIRHGQPHRGGIEPGDQVLADIRHEPLGVDLDVRLHRDQGLRQCGIRAALHTRHRSIVAHPGLAAHRPFSSYVLVRPTTLKERLHVTRKRRQAHLARPRDLPPRDPRRQARADRPVDHREPQVPREPAGPRPPRSDPREPRPLGPHRRRGPARQGEGRGRRWRWSSWPAGSAARASRRRSGSTRAARTRPRASPSRSPTRTTPRASRGPRAASSTRASRPG